MQYVTCSDRRLLDKDPPNLAITVSVFLNRPLSFPSKTQRYCEQEKSLSTHLPSLPSSHVFQPLCTLNSRSSFTVSISKVSNSLFSFIQESRVFISPTCGMRKGSNTSVIATEVCGFWNLHEVSKYLSCGSARKQSCKGLFTGVWLKMSGRLSVRLKIPNWTLLVSGLTWITYRFRSVLTYNIRFIRRMTRINIYTYLSR